MDDRERIEFKLAQALVVWRERGGPNAISVAEAAKRLAERNPGATESVIRSIVTSSNLLKLEGDDILLNRPFKSLDALGRALGEQAVKKMEEQS